MRDELVLLAQRTLDACLARKIMIVTAESCTGGLIAGALTENAGSSRVFDRGFVTYSNEAKQELLGVPAAILATHGAVSAETAEAMALGALEHSRAQLALSVTGIAGPDGGSPGKPVGLVHFAVAQRERPTLLARKYFHSPANKELSRAEIRRLAVLSGLQLLLEAAAPQLKA
jgi:nicotinamide-nucleotide amidase